MELVLFYLHIITIFGSFDFRVIIYFCFCGRKFQKRKFNVTNDGKTLMTKESYSFANIFNGVLEKSYKEQNIQFYIYAPGCV